eukprot:scaffold23566_cov63-Phaeocystis_antarctica.AAC.1
MNSSPLVRRQPPVAGTRPEFGVTSSTPCVDGRDGDARITAVQRERPPRRTHDRRPPGPT